MIGLKSIRNLLIAFALFFGWPLAYGQTEMQIVSGLDTGDSTVIDFAPSISADGKTMIFQSNRGENRSRYFLYQAKLDALTGLQTGKQVNGAMLQH